MRRSLSIRSRITVLAAFIVAVVLCITTVVVITVQRRELFANLDHSLEQRADQTAASIDRVTDATFANTNSEDRFVQLLTVDGEVAAASPNAYGLGALGPIPDDAQVIISADSLPLEDDGYRVLARRIDTTDGDRVLVVGENIDNLRDNLASLRTIMLIVVPLAVALLAAAVWWLLGRMLRPVEQIRLEVADIGLSKLDHRVPQPNSGDEIARLAATMNEMLDRLEASTKLQKRFVADASHELRTPLTRMRTELEVDLSTGHDNAATCRSVLEETVAMQALLEDLLFLARSDAPSTRNHRRARVDLDVIVTDEVRAAIGPDLPSIDISGVSAAVVFGNGGELARLVRNLLSNARRHCRGRVVVSLEGDDERVSLIVDDDGDGIPAAQREVIFRRFTRLDDARASDTGGSGLGLAICHEIVVSHEGMIEVYDSPLGGARFAVTLPSA